MAMGMMLKSKWLTNVEYDEFRLRVDKELQAHKKTTASQLEEATAYIRNIDTIANGRDEFFELVETSLSQFPTCKYLSLEEYNLLLQKINRGMQAYNKSTTISYKEAAISVQRIVEATLSKDEFLQMLDKQLAKLNNHELTEEKSRLLIEWFNSKRGDFERILNKIRIRKDQDPAFKESLVSKGIAQRLEMLERMLKLSPNEVNFSSVPHLVKIKKIIPELKYEMIQKPRDEVEDQLDIFCLCLYDIGVFLKFYLFEAMDDSSLAHWKHLQVKSGKAHEKLCIWVNKNATASKLDKYSLSRVRSYMHYLSDLNKHLTAVLEEEKSGTYGNTVDTTVTSPLFGRITTLFALTEDLSEWHDKRSTRIGQDPRKRKLIEENLGIAHSVAKQKPLAIYDSPSFKELETVLQELSCWATGSKSDESGMNMTGSMKSESYDSSGNSGISVSKKRAVGGGAGAASSGSFGHESNNQTFMACYRIATLS